MARSCLLSRGSHGTDAADRPHVCEGQLPPASESPPHVCVSGGKAAGPPHFLQREYLTGFHKRKVERRKVAVEEIKRKLKEEQRKMKEERHKEYLKMLTEREEALDEADELEHLVTSQTESVSIDHPNHTVTVTTVSDLDLSGARQLGLSSPGGGGSGLEEKETLSGFTSTLPKKSGDPFLSQRISSLTASLHARSRKKPKGKQLRRGQDPHKKTQKPSARRTSKSQRRKLTGKRGRNQD